MTETLHGVAAIAGGRIGPNAIIQTVAALRERLGGAGADAFLERTGHAELRSALPHDMVDEAQVNTLMRSVFAELGQDAALEVLDRSGALTGAYLLTNRIPKPAHILLPLLPARIALRILAGAIGKHAWTFAGTGHVAFTPGPEPAFSITGCPLCRGLTADRPVCPFYRATFAFLLRALVSRSTQVTETACQAAGAPACRFTIRL
jgi:divinyl protochlorophyllide a 8-vinyl-reductase